jgi:hypothetical protein
LNSWNTFQFGLVLHVPGAPPALSQKALGAIHALQTGPLLLVVQSERSRRKSSWYLLSELVAIAAFGQLQDWHVSPRVMSAQSASFAQLAL